MMDWAYGYAPEHSMIANFTDLANDSTFIPVSVQPEPNREQITDFITSNSSVLTGIQLQIPTHDNSHNTMPIKLTIAQIDNYSLIELLRGLQ